MRILHTSDWHLGRTFGPISLADDQTAFLEWLVAQCSELKVDLVVIAGDIYDRAIMPTESVELFVATLRSIRATGALVAAITGNHDGALRVASYDDLLDQSGIYLRGGFSHIGEVITLAFPDAPLDVVLLPFLDPQAAPDAFADATVTADDDAVNRRVRRSHQSVLRAATDAARTKLKNRSLAVAHAFITGSQQSESERQLNVGGTANVDATVFAGFSYTALGHLHRPQQVTDTIRYSGTPLAYSFSEEHEKSITIVEMAPDGVCRIEEKLVPLGRTVRTVTGTMAELLAKPADTQSFVRAIVTDRDTVLDAKAKLSTAFPHLVEVKLQPEGVDPTLVGGASSAVREMQPLDATRRFWHEAEGSDPDDATAALLATVVADAVKAVTV